MSPLRARCGDESGIALVLTLLTLFISGIVLVSVVQYTSSNGRDARLGHSRQVAYGLAEAGINNAVSILGNSLSPTTPTLLPDSGAVAYDGGTVRYSGTFDAGPKVWTITSVSTVKNPTGGADIHRTLTRKVQVTDAVNGPTLTGWSRYYDHDTACVEVKNKLYGPFATPGPLCLKGTGQLLGSAVWAGGNVTLEASTSIGTSTTPIGLADITGTCKYVAAAANTPCSAADRVYADSIPTSHDTLTKPTVAFDYWYENAKPGPKHGCTAGHSSGTPPVFDNNTTYNFSAGEQELTPNSRDYVCKVVVGGETVGELSWNRATHTLTIKGTIFIDGDVATMDDDYLTNYSGRATLYAAGGWHNDEVVCAGGTANCRTTMSSWDPVTNMLVFVLGGKVTSGKVVDIHKQAAFQGVIWASKECDIKDNARSSGPVICDRLKFDVKENETGGFYAWPPLGTLLDGQTNGASPLPGDYAILAGEQSG